ncbi:hypothetical protein GIB67_022985, partial [Kingdonia uniflora]
DSITEHPYSKLHFHPITYTLESLHTKQDTSCSRSNKIKDNKKTQLTWLTCQDYLSPFLVQMNNG